MPEGAADIQVIFRAVLQQQGDGKIRYEADQGNQHDPSSRNGNGGHETFEAHECDAAGGEQEDEGIEEGRDDPGSVIAEGTAVGGGSGSQHMGIEREKEGALIDEIVPRVADQADAVGEKAAGKLRDDDDGIDRQGDSELGAKFVVGVGKHRL